MLVNTVSHHDWTKTEIMLTVDSSQVQTCMIHRNELHASYHW